MSEPRDPDSTTSYTVAWICALEEEYFCAARMLDEEFTGPEIPEDNDDNTYIYGRISKHYVVIGCLPAGRYGTNSAARVARDMVRTFPHLRFALMVGIGGGAPTARNDIRLGDVVVSQPVDGFGGVIQYDLGKILQNGRFQKTGQLNAPPEKLLGVIPEMRRLHMDKKKPDRLAEHLQRLSDIEGYQRPAADYLYATDYLHLDGKNCDRCDSQSLVDRLERLNHRELHVHYGTIASGNSVLKNARVRDTYSTDPELNILCFEMEAAGLMNNVPCLVIRGICDYCDSHKNDNWHKYAALTAAAYARELLLVLRPQRVDAMPPWADRVIQELQQVNQELNSLANNQRVFQTTIESFRHETKLGVRNLESDNYFEKISKWLSPPDTSTNLSDALQERHKGTGIWFLHGEIFQRWKNGVGRCLWLYGIPGCGKTILSATIIGLLNERTEPSHVILYFFFDFAFTEKQSLNKLLRSLIIQLYSKCVTTRVELDKAFSFCENGKRQPTQTLLSSTFRQMLKRVESVKIVVDAIDECTTRKDLLLWIEDLMGPEYQGLQLLVTSRKEQEIESGLQRWLHTQNIVAIQQDPVNHDIRAYVHERLRNDRGFERWHCQPDVLLEIETELMWKADGMFRWAVCQLDTLQKSLDIRMLRSKLRSLPETLEQTYGRILASIDKDYQLYAIRILQFLTYSERPLTIQEAVDIMAVDLHGDPQFDLTFRMPDPREIMKVCSSLVHLTSRQNEDNTTHESMELQLAHFSVQQYLKSDRIEATFPKRTASFGPIFQNDLSEKVARGMIVKVCLAYLSNMDDRRTIEETKKEFPLAQYSAQYWVDHAKSSETTKGVQESILNFFLRQEKAYTIWGKLFDPDQPWSGTLWWTEKEMATPLYYASLTGLQRTVRLLLKEGVKMNVPGGAYNNALQAASSTGNLGIVQLLLNQGVDVNVQGGFYGNALQAASIRGHKKIVRELLARGANINSQGGLYSDALYASACEGHTEIVRLLVDRGANINAKGGINIKALQDAPFQDHKNIMPQLIARRAKLDLPSGLHCNTSNIPSIDDQQIIAKQLVDKKVETMTQDSFYGNALHAALMSGREETIKLLGDTTYKGIPLSNHLGSTAVAVASFKGHIDVVRVLLDQGADINAATNDGTTPLSMASYNGQVEVVKLLLKNGADISATTDDGTTPLSMGSYTGQFQIVKLLLENGADVNSADKRGSTPITLASDRGHVEVVKLLFENGAHINTPNNGGWTPITFAVQNSHLEVIKILLKSGVDVNTMSNDARTPIVFATYYGHVEVVKILLKNGADINTTNIDGWTPIVFATYYGHVEVVKILLENGADVNTTSNDGWTPIAFASYNGHVEVVKILLENGADVNTADKGGLTPLMPPSQNGHIEVVKLLLKNGGDVNTGNNNGWTPIAFASQNGHLKVVKILLENGADVNTTDKGGSTPLISPSQNGHIEVVKLLLKNGADVNTTNNNGGTPIAFASQNGHLEVVKILLKNGAKVNTTNNNGWTPIAFASQDGHLSVVKILLENGADINTADKGGSTPLIFPSQNGHIEVVKLLLKNGVDVNTANNPGWTPIAFASQNGHLEVVKILLESGANINTADKGGSTPLMPPSQNGHIEVVKLLLKNGADVNTTNNDGWTPIAFASQNGHLEVVKILLENGADVNTKDNDGWTPISRASDKRHLEVVKLLLENDADVNSKDKDGWTPIAITSYSGHIELVKLLLQNRADVNIIEKDGWTPVAFATQNGHLEVVKLLLENAADFKTNTLGRTPIALASYFGHLEVVKLLLENDAVVDSKEKDGWTPITLASHQGHIEVVKLLRKKSANGH